MGTLKLIGDLIQGVSQATDVLRVVRPKRQSVHLDQCLEDILIEAIATSDVVEGILERSNDEDDKKDVLYSAKTDVERLQETATEAFETQMKTDCEDASIIARILLPELEPSKIGGTDRDKRLFKMIKKTLDILSDWLNESKGRTWSGATHEMPFHEHSITLDGFYLTIRLILVLLKQSTKNKTVRTATEMSQEVGVAEIIAEEKTLMLIWGAGNKEAQTGTAKALAALGGLRGMSSKQIYRDISIKCQKEYYNALVNADHLLKRATLIADAYYENTTGVHYRGCLKKLRKEVRVLVLYKNLARELLKAAFLYKNPREGYRDVILLEDMVALEINRLEEACSRIIWKSAIDYYNIVINDLGKLAALAAHQAAHGLADLGLASRDADAAAVYEEVQDAISDYETLKDQLEEAIWNKACVLEKEKAKTIVCSRVKNVQRLLKIVKEKVGTSANKLAPNGVLAGMMMDQDVMQHMHEAPTMLTLLSSDPPMQLDKNSAETCLRIIDWKKLYNK